MTSEFYKIFERDLDRLEKEIQSFNDQADIWKTLGSAPNSAGNLCLHLTGNLQTFVGNNMGGYTYIRDRDAEFNSKDIPKTDLINEIKKTKQIVLQAIDKMSEDDLKTNHPQNVLGYEMSNNFFLIHLAAHFSYHLGQINYLRRILE